ncbi:FG-GAP repeat-containing protein [Actinomadura meyerae]|uniref:FG-GAP repeat-containing protein n=1 Tax=Actinomadura meyerae TaxID=240840 RepID=A0A239DBE1_9ACTN|nr:FG-GAP and VCBS repeat-containing protein [Actinomadura meyerae]SNS29432.1 FG-GAP repeat-containing protein [Actinomadura meyerae]
MQRRSLIAVGAVLIAGLGAAAATTLDDDRRPNAVPSPARSPAGPLRPVTPAQPATFTKPAKAADFNGDGYGDLVVSGRTDVKDPKKKLSLIDVVYGSPQGPAPGRRQSFGPSTPGLPAGTYGVSTTDAADFDRDGYADLVVHTLEARNTSSLVIFYGSATGLGGRTVLLQHSDARSFDGLAVGDFDGKGGKDLVVTGRGDCWVYRDVTTEPVTPVQVPVTGRVGAEVTRNGIGPGEVAAARRSVTADVNGDGRSDLVLIVATPAADGEEGEDFWNAELRLGTADGLSTKAVGFGNDKVLDDIGAPVAGDVNGDGKTDVITAAPGTGTYAAFLGTAHGLRPAKQITFPARDGVRRLTIGDTDGDGDADLTAIGLPTLITALSGGEHGLDPVAARRIDRAAPSVPVPPGTDLRAFGANASLTDLNGDGKDDLSVETAHYGEGQGHVLVFPGSDFGLTLQGATSFSKADLN